MTLLGSATWVQQVKKISLPKLSNPQHIVFGGLGVAHSLPRPEVLLERLKSRGTNPPKSQCSFSIDRMAIKRLTEPNCGRLETAVGASTDSHPTPVTPHAIHAVRRVCTHLVRIENSRCNSNIPIRVHMYSHR
ncbi:hypothetical protein J1614_008879 [Plenodomus biglobosus]|nr:hypothetical protein J1614_008879 [Plenodomus biglobosus]